MRIIKVPNQVYQDLEKLKKPGEEMADVLVRLIQLQHKVTSREKGFPSRWSI